jgi:hypothetical protein
MNQENDMAKPEKRSRFSPVDKESRGRVWITERDEKLLVDLFLHQAMSRGQLQDIHFGSTARCNARLRKLYDHGYVVRDFHPMAPYGSQGIYRVGPKAATLVARHLDADAGYIKSLCRGSKRLEFLEHTLEIVDFSLWVRRSLKQGNSYTLESWMPELQVRHEYELGATGGATVRHVFKPDAFLRLRESENRLHAFFLEIDRGNASAASFAQKASHYEQYLSSGLFQEMYGAAAFSVLVVTTGEKRAQHLLATLPQLLPAPFCFCLSSQFKSRSFFDPIWLGNDGQARCLLPKLSGGT